MVKLNVLNQKGETVDQISLSEKVFGITPHPQALFDGVLVYRANARQGTSKTKKRDEVRGGGKKPWKQKGTGRARQGSIRSPQWRGGGVVFGPDGNQNYTLKINRKVRDLALRSALSCKALDKEIIIVDKIAFDKPKTKSMLDVLSKIKANGKTLIIASEKSFDDNAIKASINIPNLMLVAHDQLNAYDLMNCKTLVITKDAVAKIEEVLVNGQN
jgi:large subunit ribosomal protein L4